MRSRSQSTVVRYLSGAALLLAAAAVFGFWLTARITPRDTWSSPDEMTQSHITQVLFWANDYHSQNGVWPATQAWRSELSNYIDDKREQKAFEDSEKDAWGTPLVCEAVDDGRSFRCYSLGANRINDYGRGDDIVGVVKDEKIAILEKSSATTQAITGKEYGAHEQHR